MSTATLPVLDSLGIYDRNSLLRRYLHNCMIYQFVPVPVMLVGWYTLKLAAGVHAWFWPTVLGVHCMLSFVCAFQAAARR